MLVEEDMDMDTNMTEYEYILQEYLPSYSKLSNGNYLTTVDWKINFGPRASGSRQWVIGMGLLMLFVFKRIASARSMHYSYGYKAL